MKEENIAIFQHDSIGSVFYNLDKAIRTYRQFAHEQLTAMGLNITVDQWLVLKALHENPERSQHDIAAAVFKDHASFTRIVELLVQKGFLLRELHPTDRRRFSLRITKNGSGLLREMQPIMIQVRGLVRRAC